MTGNIIFFDTETTGLEDTDATIQIAAIATKGWEEIDAFDAKIEFDLERVNDLSVLRDINSYDPEVWAVEAVPPQQALEAFVAFCKKYRDLELTSKKGNKYKVVRLAGHNITGFDIPRIKRGVDHFELFWPALWWYPLDTYARAIWHFAELGLEPPENYRLATLAGAFGISTADAHDALADCRLSMQLARKLATWEGSQR